MKKRTFVCLILTAAMVFATMAEAAKEKPAPLPAKFSYTILVEGQTVGASKTKVTRTSERLIFDTNTSIVFGEYKLELTSHTEADKETFEVLEFTYEGEKAGMMLGGEVYVHGDTISGCTIENGTRYPATRVKENDQIFMLEDYVAVHHVLIARAYIALGEKILTTQIFFPSTFQLSKIDMGKSAEAYLESDIKETTVTKIQLQVSGAHQFISFYDPKRGMPVYMAFPGVNTEVFLDEFYGDNPVSRYRLPKVQKQ